LRFHLQPANSAARVRAAGRHGADLDLGKKIGKRRVERGRFLEVDGAAAAAE
jgi:hypothetical protein